MKNTTPQAELAQIVAELTPEQRELLATATPQDWAQGLVEAATDRQFWQGVMEAFVAGLTGR